MSKKSNNKKFHTLVGLFLVAVILLSGTYAWQSFNQGAFNPLHHHTNPGGRIHNYFEVSEVGIARWNDPTRGEGTFDLSILGENFGEREIQLRVRLHEFLLLDGGEDGYGIGGADINDVTTWPIFTIDGNFDATGGFDRADGLIAGAVEIGQEGNIEWFLGDFGDNGGLTYFMPTHNRITEDLSLPEHAANWATLLANTSVRDYFIDQDLYRFTNTTGRAFDALAGGQLLTGTIAPDVTHAADFYNEGYGVVTGDPTATGEFDEFAGAEFADYLIYFDHNDELQVSATPVTHYGQLTETPELNGVMTYEQWVNDYDRAFGNFWILDTETGWFYWRGQDVNGLGVLEVGTDGLTNATSLLLNQISINPTALAWQYIIHVDADLWFPGEAPIDANESILERLVELEDLTTYEIVLVTEPITNALRGQTTTIANVELHRLYDGVFEEVVADAGLVANITTLGATSTVNIGSPLELAVASNESNDTLTIEITHPNANTFVIDIFVEHLNLPEASVGCEQTGNPVNIWTDETGFQWCVVTTEGNYSMLIARHTVHMADSRWNNGINNSRSHYINEFTRWPLTTAGTGGPEARDRVHLWWNHNTQVSQDLRNAAVDANIPTLWFSLYWVTNPVRDARMDLNYLSSPITGSAGNTPVFFLNEVEVNTLISAVPASRLATRVDPADHSNSGIPSWYWLRSSGSSSMNSGSVIANQGTLNSLNVDSVGADGSFRPAVWVRR